jgi:hypothetical protein
MARLNKIDSKRLEHYEGALGCLGNALILVELVEIRVGLAVPQLPGLLGPAIDDLGRAKGLIRQGQIMAGLHGCACPTPAPTEVENAAV